MRVVLCDEAPFGAIMQFIALNVRAAMVFHGCEPGNNEIVEAANESVFAKN
jgi:hypothetical protein